jgi:hypothetical protein
VEELKSSSNHVLSSSSYLHFIYSYPLQLARLVEKTHSMSTISRAIYEGTERRMGVLSNDIAPQYKSLLDNHESIQKTEATNNRRVAQQVTHPVVITTAQDKSKSSQSLNIQNDIPLNPCPTTLRHDVPCPSRHRIDVWRQRCLLRHHWRQWRSNYPLSRQILAGAPN